MDGPTTFRALIAPSVSLAGLLLVFVGFLLYRAGASESGVRAREFKWMAKSGLIPVALALLCSGLCVLGLAWGIAPFLDVVVLFIGVLVVTSTYAVLAISRI